VISLVIEAASTSETSINFYQTTRRNNAENSHLFTRRRENLKVHGINHVFHHNTKSKVLC
jgi:hypothetical protein